MIRKTLTLLLFYFGLSFSYSQCINDSNKIGYFDESSISTNWTTTGNGSNFSVETLDFYYREQSKTGGALKVVVNSNNSDYIKMYNNGTCGSNYTFASGASWNVSLYIKGDLGDELDFTLVDGDASNAAKSTAYNHTIKYKGWHYIRFNITPDGATSNGRLKINFKNSGTYLLDNIILSQDAWDTWIVAPSGGDYTTIQDALENNNYGNGDIILVKDKIDGYHLNTHDGSYNNVNDHNGKYVDLTKSTILDNHNGTINRPIVIRNFIEANGTHHTPKIKTDGSDAIAAGKSDTAINHLEIAGFEIEGPNQNITYTQANTYRQSIVNAVYTDPSNPDKDQAAWNGGNRKNIFHGNGISIKRGTYINVHGNKVHNTTGS